MGRIDQYPECTTPDNNDLLLIETTEGTKKIKKQNLLKAVMDLLGDDDISEIGDGTVTGAITDLNNDLNNKQDKSWVEGWDITKQEHYILVITSGGGNVGFYIPQIAITDTATIYQGGSYAGNPYGVGVSIRVSNAAVIVVTAKVNGGDVASTLKIYSR